MEIKRGLSLTSVSGRITKIEADPLGPLVGLIDPKNPQIISLHGLSPSSGGGISNIVFYKVLLLARTPNSTDGWHLLDRNIRGADGSTTHQLQDSQTVLLNLNWLS